MRNIYTNSVKFEFAPVNTFGYSNNQKYAKGILRYDSKGNASFSCNNYNYCNCYELLEFLKCHFDTEYYYRAVKISFYGKNTRSIKIGRTSIEVTAEDKINVNGEYFLPDLALGLNIIKLYDSIKPYGFNRIIKFVNKTSEEIKDFFEVKFVTYELNFKSYLESNKIPSAATCWKQYVAETSKTYSQWEWEHSHCENVDLSSTFKDINYTLPTAFKVVGSYGTLITGKYHREYDILEVKVFDPSNRVKCHIPNLIVYVPKDRDRYNKVYTFPEFEKYIRKECTFNSIYEAACSLIDRLSN